MESSSGFTLHLIFLHAATLIENDAATACLNVLNYSGTVHMFLFAEFINELSKTVQQRRVTRQGPTEPDNPFGGNFTPNLIGALSIEERTTALFKVL
ncbi:hypothetical protein [Streptomyces sp. PSAA01]|uniref:hypothetical protein n=1 Tax=Streptomyces sp. PSAA01 TaxID=2912762 RepID=UPI001F434D7A|nr:hypothetical protein [Streptomyces sp. PSAA01]MCG0286109.1 hypothetical protein [Streptomyces sp. PSAA01]